MGRGGGGYKQPKMPPGDAFGRGCKISYIYLEGGGGATWKPL